MSNPKRITAVLPSGLIGRLIGSGTMEFEKDGVKVYSTTNRKIHTAEKLYNELVKWEEYGGAEGAIRVSQRLCKTCKYSGSITGGGRYSNSTRDDGALSIYCNYISCMSRKNVENKSRIFVDGNLSYNPDFCTKYEKRQGRKRKAETWELTNNSIYKNGYDEV